VMVRLAALRAGYASGGDWEIPLDTGSATAFQVTDGALSVVTHADRRELPRGAGHLLSMTATVAASPTP
jgi:hypothetical protein